MCSLVIVTYILCIRVFKCLSQITKYSKLKMNTYLKYSFMLFLILCCVLYLFYGHFNVNYIQNFEINNKISDKYISILYWDTYYGNEAMSIGLGHEIFSSCPVNNCVTTTDKSLKQIEDFDAIVFHGARYKFELNGKPYKRSYKQRYIFFSWESAYNTYFEMKANNYFYNWTMTFKKNSDIYYPYFIFSKEKTNYTLPTEEFVRNKSKNVAWFVSNCWSDGGQKRMEFAKRLQKYIPIDIYGKCGTLSCPRSKNVECYKMLEKEYKFYLSFENSFCPDYITEKLFNIAQYNIIPVVWGGANYSDSIPPNSVINARNFTSEENLAKFLLEVGNDSRKYLEYFQWKKDYVVRNTQEMALCKMCKMLNEDNQYKSYSDIKKWFLNNCSENM